MNLDVTEALAWLQANHDEDWREDDDVFIRHGKSVDGVPELRLVKWSWGWQAAMILGVYHQVWDEIEDIAECLRIFDAMETGVDAMNARLTELREASHDAG